MITSILKNSLFFTVMMCVCIVHGQRFSKKIEGRVYSKDADVAATHISNINANKGTIADAKGFFTITAKLNDTLMFSAVQYKRKLVVVTLEALQGDLLLVPLEPSLTQLDEVVVTPYNLSGDLNRDVAKIKIEPVVTSTTLGLPNAYVKVKTQNERKLFEADNGKFVSFGRYSLDSLFEPVISINLHKILNRITGRTQKLKKYVAIDQEIALLKSIRNKFPDSVYVNDLKIPKETIHDFLNFCEADANFDEVLASDDVLKLWRFFLTKSVLYRKANNLK